MAKTKISEYSATSADNTDISNINIAEGCSPANVNNAIRTVMAQLKDQQTGTSGDNFTVGGNLSVTGTSTLTGNVTAPTQSSSDNSTKVATTAFVTTKVGTLGTMASQNATAVAITGGTITGITDLTVADGGTGVSTLSANAVLLGNGASALQTVAPSTSGNLLTSNGTTWTSTAPNKLTSDTAQTTTSGTSKSFTNIPSWAKKITVILNGVNTNGSNHIQVQLGSTTSTTTGYLSYFGYQFSTATGTASLSSGFGIYHGGATDVIYAQMTITNISGNTWVASHAGAYFTGSVFTILGGGSVALSGVLDRVQLSTISTDTFSAGSVNIFYE